MINKITFGSFIRQKRIEKGLTQKELAENLFLSESAVSKWEMGKSYPDITMIPDICRVLDVSEHELIAGANDTEYRKMKEDARLYRKISETFFCGFTAVYIIGAVISVVCDLCINKKFTFSLTTLAGILTAFTFVPSCIRFTENHKLAVFAGSTYLSLVLLFLTCCLRLHGNWFGIAALGTLLGYIIVFGYFLLKKYLPESVRKFIPLIYFSACFLCIFLMISVAKITVDFSVKNGIFILLFSSIPFAISGAVHLLKCSRKIKAAADVFAFGATAYACQYVVNKIIGIDASGDYTVNFADWQNCINGNIYLIIFCVCIAASAVLFITGLRDKKS